jgi:hypothetical protein
VGNTQAGILGLEEIFRRVQVEGFSTDADLEKELLALAGDFGNYIAPSAEQSYKEAFLREYRKFCKQEP